MSEPAQRSLVEFKNDRVATEFKTEIHPDIRLLIVELGQFSRDKRLPPPCGTQIYRSPDQNVQLYVDWWRGLQLKLLELNKVPALGHSTAIPTLFGTDANFKLALSLAGLSTEQLEERARQRVTLHSWFAAIDLRQFHYTHFQKDMVWQWLLKRCDPKEWERREDLHGTGPHFHVGRKDDVWIQKKKLLFLSHKAANTNAS